MKKPDMECARKMASNQFDASFHHTTAVKEMVVVIIENWKFADLIDTEKPSCENCKIEICDNNPCKGYCCWQPKK